MKTPLIGVPIHFSNAAAHLSAKGDRRANARLAIYEFHVLLRDKNSIPDTAGSIIVQTVSLYRETSYIHEKLKCMIGREELRLIENIIGDFLSLASNPGIQLPEAVRKMMDHAIPFARFHAGIFALARNDREAALTHFSRAEDNWGVKAKKLVELLTDKKLSDAAGRLGDCFSRLKRLISLAADRPIGYQSGRKPTLVVPVLPESGTSYRLVRAELNALSPKTSPDTSIPRTRLGWPFRRK
jgi:hypothetical protein